MSPEVQLVFAIGLVVIAVLAVGLFTVRNFGAPHHPPAAAAGSAVVEFYDRFEEGVFSIEAAPRAAGWRS